MDEDQRKEVRISKQFDSDYTISRFYTFALKFTNMETIVIQVKGKSKATMLRDKMAEIKLNVLGWRVITLWECQLKKANITTTLTDLLTQIK